MILELDTFFFFKDKKLIEKIPKIKKELPKSRMLLRKVFGARTSLIDKAYKHISKKYIRIKNGC